MNISRVSLFHSSLSYVILNKSLLVFQTELFVHSTKAKVLHKLKIEIEFHEDLDREKTMTNIYLLIKLIIQLQTNPGLSILLLLTLKTFSSEIKKFS